MPVCDTIVRQENNQPQYSFPVAGIQWHISDETWPGMKVWERF